MTISGTNQSLPVTKDLYADYKFSGAAFNDPSLDKAIKSKFGSSTDTRTYSFASTYSLPLSSIKNQVIGTEQIIEETRRGMEDALLRKLFINPYIEPDLDDAHTRIWKEVASITALPETMPASSPPPYICFDEYLFAERHASSASRRLIAEYDELISQSTFSYFFQLRKLLNYFFSEINNIKSSLLFDFGEDYENESQQKIALRYDTWAKMAVHYTRRIASTILSKPGEIPNAEVDKITKKQAAQFQAFFAIRLNAVDEEINDLLGSLKRDLVDNSEIFYKRYLSNSLRMANDLVEPLDLDFNTTNFTRQFPELAKEIILATNVLQGNFASIHADLVERFEMFISRADAVFMLIHEKRRFAHNIAQLASRAVQKRKILEDVNDDIYSTIFRMAPVNNNRNNTFESSHARLDDLEADHHPQYLLKDGGTITGDIDVTSGTRIGGVDLAGHKHTGSDGSIKIRSIDIDYDTARLTNSEDESITKQPLSLSIQRFIPDILDGGIPVFTTVINIEIDDDISYSPEFEIIYTEVE